jgi:hypothetical protein
VLILEQERVLLIGGSWDGFTQFMHKPPPTIRIIPREPAIRFCVEQVTGELAPPEPIPSEVYQYVRLSNGSKVWVEEQQFRDHAELQRKAEKLIASARDWAEDADFFSSTFMAELARATRIDGEVAQAQANHLLRPRWEALRCPAKPAR